MRKRRNYHHGFLLVLGVLLSGNGWAEDIEICRPSPLGDVTSLIACINAANLSPDDTIVDLGGTSYKLLTTDNGGINGNNGLPQILPTATGGKLFIINGTIYRDPNAVDEFRFLLSQSGSDLTLFNITLEFGVVDNGGATNADSGGAILNLGELHMLNCVLSNNSAFYQGGAIANMGNISAINNSSISGNIALSNAGGAIFNNNNIESLSNCTFSGNISPTAGGIANFGTLSSINSSTFSDNDATTGDGGAIYNNVAGVINRMDNCTLSGNSAFALGGGLINFGLATIFNTTISGNSAVQGGGIHNAAAATISSLISNLIASNTSSGGVNSGPDIKNLGTILSESYNLISSTDGNGLANGVNNDIVTTTPLVGPLQDNGGPTFTMALLPGSLAINNGINPNDLPFDQRGSPYFRTECGLADIGAFELPICVQ